MDNTVKQTVRKSNIFIEGRYRFDLHCQKILLLVISKIKTSHKEFISYKVDWNDIKEVSNNKLNTVTKIDRACETLKNKTITITNGDEVDNFGFLSGWKTVKGQYVEFRLDYGMHNMLLGLLESGNFTLYDLEFALALPSTHSIRIYEILKSHSWKKQPVTIELDKLKHALDIDLDSKTYTNFSNVRQFIIDRAKKHLTKYTDITFTYKPIKTGRRVTAISFNIKENKRYQKSITSIIKRPIPKVGDKVLIAGKEYDVHSGGAKYTDGTIEMAKLIKWLSEGKIKLLKGNTTD